MNTIYRKLITLFSLIFFVVFLNTIFANHTVNLEFSYIKVFLVAILYSILIFIIRKRMKPKSIKLFLIILSGITLVAQLVIVFYTYASIGWDCEGVIKNVANFTSGQEFNPIYFATYPNNTGLFLIFSVIVYLANLVHSINIWLLLDCFNVIMIDVSIWITYLVSKELFGKENAYTVVLFAIPFIALTPNMTIPYSDTISMVFPILAFYIYLKRKKVLNHKAKNRILTMLLGITITLGVLIKPTCMIIGIAIIITDILYEDYKKHTFCNLVKKAGSFCIWLIIGIVFVMIGFSVVESMAFSHTITKEKREEVETPFTHFIMMGLTKQQAENGKYYYGSYASQDALATRSHVGKSEKIKYHIEEIKKRLSSMGLKRISFIYLS